MAIRLDRNPKLGSRKHALRCLVVGSILISTFAGPSNGEEQSPSGGIGHAAVKADQAIRWYDARSLGMEGKGWSETKSFFDRLPAKAERIVRPPVWGLSRDSAGLSIRFVTDATTIQARWTLKSDQLAMPHMPATGVSGLDLYVKADDGRWRWLAVGQPRESGAMLQH